MKCKLNVYFSARHTFSPAFTRMMKSLARHVTITGQNNDPETAYASINDCDVFLLHLHVGFSQNLFLIYELGVAMVLRKPVIVTRETDLKFSDILIPKHFYETELLIPPIKRSSCPIYDVFGKFYSMPVTLGSVLECCYENSIVFCPDLHAKYVALLLDKIFSVARRLERLRKKPTNAAVEITLQNGTSDVGLVGYSIQAQSGFNQGKISLLPLKTYENDQFKTNSLVNENKLGKLSFNEKQATVSQTPEINISKLGYQRYTETEERKQLEHVSPIKLHPESRFEPINEFQNSPPREELDTSDSSSNYDVTYLNDKTFTASNYTSPLPSPTPQSELYYPTALPVYPMELCFPPFHIEKLHFDKYALQIAKADRLPSIVRRRVMRKEL